MPSWDPKQYDRFQQERNRAFFDLVGRIPVDVRPKAVVDLGCATGLLTATLGARWPNAQVVGYDSSPDMVAAAPDDLPPNVRVELGDIAEFSAEGVDVLVTNAALQWLPQHRELIARWAGELNPGGVLAWQVPGNFLSPSHIFMRKLAEGPQWKEKLAGVLRGGDSTDTAEQYARLALSAGLDADAWETTYVHLLHIVEQGEHPVLHWVRGTGLRPVLDALSSEDAAAFESQYSALLRMSYPPAGTALVSQSPTGMVTPFPFRRIFCVAQKPSA